jgi:hypothetical protein
MVILSILWDWGTRELIDGNAPPLRFEAGARHPSHTGTGRNNFILFHIEREMCFSVRLPFELIIFAAAMAFPDGSVHELVFALGIAFEGNSVLSDFFPFDGYRVVYISSAAELRTEMREPIEAVSVNIECRGKEIILIQNFVQQKCPFGASVFDLELALWQPMNQ